MQRLLARLLSPEASHAFWRSSVYLLQLLDTVAVVSHGNLLSLEVMSPQGLAAHKLPHDVAVAPLAVVAGEAAQLSVTGRHVRGADASLVVKGGGKLLHLGGVGAGCHGSSKNSCSGGCCGSKSEPDTAAAAAGAGCGHKQQQQQQQHGEEVVGCSLSVPAGGRGQVLWVEVARGAFLSQARPVLVVDDPLLAQVRPRAGYTTVFLWVVVFVCILYSSFSLRVVELVCTYTTPYPGGTLCWFTYTNVAVCWPGTAVLFALCCLRRGLCWWLMPPACYRR
jgi:hypothetical protein